MRYFKAPPQIIAAVRVQVMQAMGHPNGRADQPWSVDGDFKVGDTVYMALGPHHTEGSFAPLVEQAIQAGVIEITEQEYNAQRPVPEIEL